MSRLREAIQEMVEIQRAMGAAANAARHDAARKSDLIAIRRRFAAQVGVVSKAIEEEPRLRANPALAEEFRNRFSQMRGQVAVHQAKWPAVLLDDSDPEFNASADAVIKNNRAFAAWALQVLA